MTKDLIQELQLFTKYIPDLESHFSPKWASTYSDHRLNIRRHLYKKTKIKTVLDLDQIPTTLSLKSDSNETKYVSISHCPVLGGFVLNSQSIGLDLEQMQRLSPSVLKRISLIEERLLIPEIFQTAVWTIKESVYKCLRLGSSNMAAVHIQSCEILEEKYLKTISEFNLKKFITLTMVSKNDDLCLSLSVELAE